MSSIERMKIEASRAIHNLSSTVYHFDDMININKNTYAITIHLRNKKCIDYSAIADNINISINKAITNKVNPRENKKIGLFLNFDLEGTRDKNPVYDGYISPHLHGCIFLQEKTVNNRCKNEIIKAVKSEILKNNSYLYSQIENLWIEKLDNKMGSLLRYLSYSSKAENYTGITSQVKKTTFMYPIENKIQKANLIAPNLHVNDRQAERTKREVGDKIERLAHLIATNPVDVFGTDKGMDILGEYISLYMQCHDGKKPRTFKNLYNFMTHLVKS